jgi:hypothetical protein
LEPIADIHRLSWTQICVIWECRKLTPIGRGGIRSEGVIYACITVQAYLHYSYITATLRLHNGYIAAAFLNCGCITCISEQQNFEVLTPRSEVNKLYMVGDKIRKKHSRGLTPIPHSVQLLRSRVFCSKTKLMIWKNVLGRNK